MSGIYIPGMKMPKTCEECCLESFCNLWIEAIKMSGVELKIGAKATIRHPGCPLVPVPDHGRLIDADKLNYSKIDLLGNHLVYMVDIKDALTIIPSDKDINIQKEFLQNWHEEGDE